MDIQGPPEGRHLYDAETVDVTDPAMVVDERELQVNDRVERLNGVSEATHWGTITRHADKDVSEDWLVLDNVGVTHTDRAVDLMLAVRGSSGKSPPGRRGTTANNVE